MNIILLGPSGSGKGVQAKMLVQKFGFNYVVMGEELKKAGQTRPEIREIMAKGELVPPKLTFEIFKNALGNKAPDNVISDGYPRMIEQWNLLRNWLTQVGGKFDLVLILTVSDTELIRRLSARRFDPETGKIYNLVTDSPPADIDQSKLIQREDDKPEAIQKRLDWYKSSVVPLIEVLKKEMKVIEVDGERPIDVIHGDLVKIVEGLRANEG